MRGELLISHDIGIISRCTETLVQNNRDRKAVQESTYKDLVSELEKTYDNDNIIILSSENVMRA